MPSLEGSKQTGPRRVKSRTRRAPDQEKEACTLSRPDERPKVYPPLRYRRSASKKRLLIEESVTESEAPSVVPSQQIPCSGATPDELVQAVFRLEDLSGTQDSIEFIYEIIQSGEDVNQTSFAGFTPLAVAAASGNDALVALLLEKNADPALGSLDRCEVPLHHSARLGHAMVCQLLAQPSRTAGVLEKADTAGWTPLHRAAEGGHVIVVRILLRAGAQASLQNMLQGRPAALHLAARAGHLKALEELLECDADPNTTDALGLSALHFAATRADASCVAVLLRHRATVSLRGGMGNETAMEMVPDGHLSRERVVRLLSSYERNSTSCRTDSRFDVLADHKTWAPDAAYDLCAGLRGPIGVIEENEDLWL